MNTRIKNLLPLLLLLALPAVVQAQDAYSTNADGSIYTYSTNADGSANIVAYAGPPWVVTIPTNINGLTVTTIGEYAFAVTALTSVTIPGSVTNIGDSAFYDCTSLASVTISNGVTSIGEDAFDYCTSLSGITIPASVTSIGESAFSYCSSLTAITVDTNNPSYSSTNGVLFNQNKSTLVEYPGGLGGSYAIPGSVTSIGTNAFAESSLNGITIPESVTDIGDGAFANCTHLTSVTIPNSVTSIGTYAFWECTRLTSVTIPASVTSIGVGVFESCTHLTSVTIPNSVTSIGDLAFYNCSSLTNATILNSVTSIGSYAFCGCTSLTSVTIPNSVTSIGSYAFDNCSSLTSVTIPNSVTSIGDGAFDNCTSLMSITVDAVNQAYSGQGGVLFDKAQTTLLVFPGGLGGSYTITNSVTSIGDLAFHDCTSLTSVIIPNSVTSIGHDAFGGCSSLTSVTIPNSVTSIGIYAFYDCNSLTAITVDTNNPAYRSVAGALFDIGEDTLIQYPSGNTNRSYTIPGSVTSIGSYAFYDCNSLTRVYFQGNSPSPTNDSTVFSGDPGTVYYLPGTTGWGAVFDGRPTAPWFLPNPQILNFEPSFGVESNGFGFTISWATNVSVVVEAATNLANPVWIPVSTSPLTNGTSYFSDPQWTNYPGRFYRVTSAFTVGGTLTGLPAGDTVTLQDNGSDDLTLSNNGTFTFPTALPNGQSYSVTVSGTSGGTTIQTEIYPPVTANGSGTISGANVTNVAVQCTPQYTGNLDVDMYNAAVADGTANGGVPAVMVTEYGGPFRVTSIDGAPNSFNVGSIYAGQCRFITVPPGTPSCSSTILSGPAVQFGTALVCGQTFGYGY